MRIGNGWHEGEKDDEMEWVWVVLKIDMEKMMSLLKH